MLAALESWAEWAGDWFHIAANGYGMPLASCKVWKRCRFSAYGAINSSEESRSQSMLTETMITNGCIAKDLTGIRGCWRLRYRS